MILFGHNTSEGSLPDIHRQTSNTCMTSLWLSGSKFKGYTVYKEVILTDRGSYYYHSISLKHSYLETGYN
jgi:hypothetical protein